MGNYDSTGYPRGRPRLGELRPPSLNAIRHANWLDNRLKKDPEYKSVLAKRQADWKIRNLDRSREISRLTARRRKNWKEFRKNYDKED